MEAKNYQYGVEDTLQDANEAMRLYKQAIKLGCLPAYKDIGDMYQFGEGVSQSYAKALEWYKEGAKKKNYFCYLSMAFVFMIDGNINNIYKCLQLFCKHEKENYDALLETASGGSRRVVSILLNIEIAYGLSSFVFPEEFIEFLSENHTEIDQQIDESIGGDEGYTAVRTWFDITV
jgi:hypothetical protein